MHIHVMETFQEKLSNIIVQLRRETAMGEGEKTEMMLGLMKAQVVLDCINGGEIFWMCASANMAIYAIEITKLEVNGYIVTS